MSVENTKPEPSAPVTDGGSALDNLQLPSMGIRSRLRHLGPGLILMMTGVGTSHLVTAPVAGGRWGFALLWVLPISYLFKYYGFELGFRFTHATGYSLLDAMCTTKRKWILWYVMVLTIVQAALGQAGRVVAAAAVLYFGLTEFGGLTLDIWVYALIVGVLCCGLVLFGSYKAVERTAKVLVVFLVFAALGSFFFAPPELSNYAHFFIMETPAGSWFVLGSFLGLLPTGIDVSLQSSEWSKVRETGMPYVRRQLEKEGKVRPFDPFNPRTEDLTVDVKSLPEPTQNYVRRWFRLGIFDFAFGHWVSMILAVIFLSLAALWIYPSDVEGKDVMGEIAHVFTGAGGPTMMWVFLIGAMAATLSTAINYFDGWPRVVASCARNLSRSVARWPGIDKPTEHANTVWYSELNIWRATAVFSFLGSSLIIVGIPEPVFLVLAASILSLIVAPLIFFYSYRFCMKTIPKDQQPFYPSLWRRCVIWGSIIIFSVATVVVIIQTLIDT